ncbi:hypothetical protein [Catenulispora subtropica]|uniref:Integral membrane protein n=1 Tax=Catenulispora subtropica TaxID=450798 RepID=A0ABP5DPU5_9ACTN
MPRNAQHSLQQIDDELDGRLQLLEKSYDALAEVYRVLEDRVGRLLTGVSFLTAAVLALAALNSSQYATRTYYLAPFHVPLALATVVVFLVTVAFAVILLISAMAGPLGLPMVAGEEQKARLGSGGYKKDSPCYVFKSSQLDYEDITDLDRSEWDSKWSGSRQLRELKRNREESLKDGIRSLAVKISFKHDRNAEAVVMLIYALLAFAGAVFVVALAAYQSAQPPRLSPLPVQASSQAPVASGQATEITLRLWARLALSVIFGTYFWLALALPNRKEQHYVSSRHHSMHGLMWSSLQFKKLPTTSRVQSATAQGDPVQQSAVRRLRGVFSAVTFILVVLMLIYDNGWPIWAKAAVIIPELLLVYACIAIYVSIVRRSRPYRTQRGLDFYVEIVVVIMISMMAVGGVTSELNGWYFGQFMAVWLASLVLLVAALLRPTLVLSMKHAYHQARNVPAMHFDGVIRNHGEHRVAR